MAAAARRGVSLIINQNTRNILYLLRTQTHSITITMFIFFKRIFRFCSLYTSNKLVILNQNPMMMKLTKCITIAHGAALSSQWPLATHQKFGKFRNHNRKKTIRNVRCALTRSFFVIVRLYVTTRLRLRLRPGNQASLLRCR